MPRLLTVLFAVIDTKVWDLKQLTSWADTLIARSECSDDWLTALSLSKSEGDALKAVRQAMMQHQVVLPDDMANLMVGLVLVRLSSGALGTAEAKCQLVDEVDGSPCDLGDPESVMKIDLDAYASKADSADKRLNALEADADRQLRRLSSASLKDLVA